AALVPPPKKKRPELAATNGKARILWLSAPGNLGALTSPPPTLTRQAVSCAPAWTVNARQAPPNTRNASVPFSRILRESKALVQGRVRRARQGADRKLHSLFGNGCNFL